MKMKRNFRNIFTKPNKGEDKIRKLKKLLVEACHHLAVMQHCVPENKYDYDFYKKFVQFKEQQSVRDCFDGTNAKPQKIKI